MAESTEPSRYPTLVVVASRPSEPAIVQRRETAVSFNRHELSIIFNVYGRKVAEGEWRDYALDFLPAKAVFSIFRRSSEFPLYRVEKVPDLARRQGAYAVIAASGMVLRRGHDLARVIRVLDKGLRVVGD